MEIKMVTMEEPCSSCVIIVGALREILQRFSERYQEVNVEVVELKHPSEVYSVEGLEVEKFPALIINGEQISAGSIVTLRQLEGMMME